MRLRGGARLTVGTGVVAVLILGSAGLASAECGDGTFDVETEECDYALAAVEQVCSEQCRVRCDTNVNDTATDHTCQHVSFGPFGAVAANAHPGIVNSVISQTHVHFTVTMAKDEADQTLASAVNLFPIKSSSFALYLGDPEPVTVLDSDGDEVPPSLEASITTCSAGLSRVQVHALDLDESYMIVFPAEGAAFRTLVLEELGEHARFHSFDSDGDGFGSPESVLLTWCKLGEDSLVQDDSDCDDTRASVFPGAVELCDGVDNDCDGEVEGSVCQDVTSTDVASTSSEGAAEQIDAQAPDDETRDAGASTRAEQMPAVDAGSAHSPLTSNVRDAGGQHEGSNDSVEASTAHAGHEPLDASATTSPARGAIAPGPDREGCGCTTVGARSRSDVWGAVGALVLLSCGLRRRVTGLRHRSVTS